MAENAQSRSMTSPAPVQRTTPARCVRPECGASVILVSAVVSVWTSLMDMNVRSHAFAILNMSSFINMDSKEAHERRTIVFLRQTESSIVCYLLQKRE